MNATSPTAPRSTPWWRPASRASAASTSWSTMSAARRLAGRSRCAEEVWDAQVDFNLKSVFLACKHVLPVMERQKARRDRQHRLDLRHPLHRRLPGRLCRDQGRRHPALARGRRAIRGQGHPREHAWCRGSCTRRWWRRGSPASAPAATSKRCCKQRLDAHPDRLCRRRPRHRQRRAVPRLRRGALHHRHGDRGRRRHERALRLGRLSATAKRRPPWPPARSTPSRRT